MKRLALAGIVALGIAQVAFGVDYRHEGVSLVYEVSGPTALGDILRQLIHECEVEGCSETEVEEARLDILAAGGSIGSLYLK